MFRHVQTQICVKWLKYNSVLKLKQNYLCGEAGYAISKSCTNQVTQKCVGGYNWDVVVHQVRPAVNER